MNHLSPSILACDFGKLLEQIKIAEDNGVDYLHIDVMDGMFVPNISIGVPVVQSLRKGTDMFFDVHLMVNEPIRYVEAFAKAGADLINIHYEACSNVDQTLDKIKSLDKKVGITIKPNTKAEDIFPYISKVDMVLIMTVEPGFGGQSFMTECLSKVKEIRHYANCNGHNIDIEVDGGVTIDNVKQCMDAGANIFVAGTAIFGGDIAKNCNKFLNIINK